jgi:hypothetical protein
MNISRLPGDLLLDVAYQIDDAEALVNIAQVRSMAFLCQEIIKIILPGLEANASHDY